ncbi:hypothetical protein [Vibrio mexicanus]|uniref:hypothetical protein n=1 Tax=Vibrio mexicanus TaxID=1004326 RepID=UPI00063C0B0D|nr:hypothetical protein [Vibrio mexicanus]
MLLNENRITDIPYINHLGKHDYCSLLEIPEYKLYHVAWIDKGKAKGMHFAWSPEEEIIIDHGMLPIMIRETLTEAIKHSRAN